MGLPKVRGTRIRKNRYSLNLAVPVVLQPKYGRDRLTNAIGTADPKKAEEAVTRAKAKFLEELEGLRNHASLQELIAQLPEDQRALFDEAGGLEGLLKAYEASMMSLTFMAGDIPPDEGASTDLEVEKQNAMFDAAENVIRQWARKEAKTLNSLGQVVSVPGGDFETIEDVSKIVSQAVV